MWCRIERNKLELTLFAWESRRILFVIGEREFMNIVRKNTCVPVWIWMIGEMRGYVSTVEDRFLLFGKIVKYAAGPRIIDLLLPMEKLMINENGGEIK